MWLTNIFHDSKCCLFILLMVSLKSFLVWCIESLFSTPKLIQCYSYTLVQFSSVQFSPVAQSGIFFTPWTAASITNFRSLLKLKSIESVMPSNHLILCNPLSLLPSITPSLRVFSYTIVNWGKKWGQSWEPGKWSWSTQEWSKTHENKAVPETLLLLRQLQTAPQIHSGDCRSRPTGGNEGSMTQLVYSDGALTASY